MNHCSKCGLDFRSVSAFDRHRVGDFGNWCAKRRCLTPAELMKLGMVETDGRWSFPLTPADKARLNALYGRGVGKRGQVTTEEHSLVVPAGKEA